MSINAWQPIDLVVHFIRRYTVQQLQQPSCGFPHGRLFGHDNSTVGSTLLDPRPMQPQEVGCIEGKQRPVVGRSVDQLFGIRLSPAVQLMDADGIESSPADGNRHCGGNVFIEVKSDE